MEARKNYRSPKSNKAFSADPRYDPVNKNYGSSAYGDDGSSSLGAYVFDGNTSTYSGKFVVGGKQYLSRVTEVFAADWMSFMQNAEISADGNTWIPLFEAKFTKVKAAQTESANVEKELVKFEKEVAVLAQDSSPIVDPGAKFERIFTGGFFLESPAVSPDGLVYFSDITYTSPSGMQAGHIWRYDPRSGVTSIFRSPSGMANGIIFDARGDMIVAEGADFGGRRVSRTDMQTGKSYIVAGLYNGHPFNAPNDLTVDAKGRIYFTDPRYLGHEPIEQPVMGVYRIDPDSSVHLLAANLWVPNGIAVSPDQKTLYVVSVGSYSTNILETPPIEGGPPSAVHAYDLLDDGTLRLQKQLVTFPDGTWGDGMTVDIDGNIYVAVSGTLKERGVYVYTSAGRRLAFLPTPEDAVNLDFGRGADADVLYVVCSRDVAARGPRTPPLGNGLYRIRLHRRGFHASPP